MVLGDQNFTRNLTFNDRMVQRKSILGAKTDDKLTFTSHLGYIIKKVTQKLHALSKVYVL